MTDHDLMPWGWNKGKQMGLIPFAYFMKLYKKRRLNGDILRYFEDKLKALEASERETVQDPNHKPKKYIIENYKFRHWQ